MGAFVQQTGHRGGFVEYLCLSYAAEHSVPKFITIIVINLVTPKAAAKLELLLNRPTLAAYLCSLLWGFLGL